MATVETVDAAAPILDSLRSRRPDGRWGIGTAKSYLDATPPNLFDVSLDEWQAVMEKAADTLTYCEREATIEALSWSVLGEEGRDRLGRNMPLLPVKRAKKPANIEGFVLAFDYTLTTIDEDRDFDVLEPKGATVDMLGPLLFNHVTLQPIGKPLKILKQNSKRLAEQSAIMDFPFGRDVAQMIEFQVLRRMSHGFLPTKYEERTPKKADDEDEAVGWHIMEYEIMERSVVSVASNRGAIIEAWNLLGEKGFHDDRVKGWLKSVYEARPVIGRGFAPDRCLICHNTSARQAPHHQCNCCDSPAPDPSDCDQTPPAFRWPATAVRSSDVVDPAKEAEPQSLQYPAGKSSKRLTEDGVETCELCDAPAVTTTNMRHQWCEDHTPEVCKRKTALIPFNKSAGSTFDVWREHLEPAKLEYDWASRYIGCQVKHLFWVHTKVPKARIGSWLTGLREVLADYSVEDTRHISSGGEELPPKYEIIQLTPDKADDFLVQGLQFRCGPDRKFVLGFEPYYGMLEVIFYTSDNEAAKQFAREVIGKTWEWSRVNNFLKGQAFSLTGGFLPKTGERWDGLFLPDRNKRPVMRAVEAVNEKRAAASNRGMILMGPPGTGKTLSARIVRNLADATFIWVAARDFWNVGAFGAFTHSFDLARELAPSVICFEDVDNWINGGGTEELLKSEMDGMNRSSGVLTLLTTNYPELIPDALIDRPGRFHDVLLFDLPDGKVRGEMLAAWLPEAPGKDRKRAVGKTDGYSGAHIFELAEYAKTLRDEDSLSIGEALLKAIDKIEEQRELITGVQLEGSRYKPNRSGFPGQFGALIPAKVFAFGNKTEKTVPGNPSGGSGDGTEGTWSKLKLSDFTDKDWGDLSAAEKGNIKKYFAWHPGTVETFADLKLGHHFASGDDAGKASLNGVRNALARANQVDGIGDELERVMTHLRAHLPERSVVIAHLAVGLDDDAKRWLAAIEKLEEAWAQATGKRSGDEKETLCKQTLAWLAAAATEEELRQAKAVIDARLREKRNRKLRKLFRLR
jgi:hypothetical protein